MADEVSSVEFKAEYDGNALKAGLEDLYRDLEKAEQGVEGLFSDMVRMAPSLDQMAGYFAKMGAMGAGAMSSIIAASPLLQTKMAEIGLAMGEGLRKLAPAIAPILDDVLMRVNQISEAFDDIDPERLEKLFRISIVAGATAAAYRYGGPTAAAGTALVTGATMFPEEAQTLWGRAQEVGRFGFEEETQGAKMAQVITTGISTAIFAGMGALALGVTSPLALTGATAIGGAYGAVETARNLNIDVNVRADTRDFANWAEETLKKGAEQFYSNSTGPT